MIIFDPFLFHHFLPSKEKQRGLRKKSSISVRLPNMIERKPIVQRKTLFTTLRQRVRGYSSQ